MNVKNGNMGENETKWIEQKQLEMVFISYVFGTTYISVCSIIVYNPGPWPSVGMESLPLTKNKQVVIRASISNFHTHPAKGHRNQSLNSIFFPTKHVNIIWI